MALAVAFTDAMKARRRFIYENKIGLYESAAEKKINKKLEVRVTQLLVRGGGCMDEDFKFIGGRREVLTLSITRKFTCFFFY